jgi:hypothetical protein
MGTKNYYTISNHIPMSLTTYYPGENEESQDNSVRIGSIVAK